MGIDPTMEDPAHNVEGIYSEDLDFLGLPPEKAQELMDIIQAFLQMSMQEGGGGQMPPMDPMMAMPQGPMPQGPMPQGMPQGAPQMPPGGLQLPPAPMGMEEGGMVPGSTMEDLHHQIAETKARLKEKEKEVRDSYQPQKQQQQQVGFQQGGQVPLAQQQGGPDLRPFVQQAMNSRMKRRQAIEASMNRAQPVRGYQEGGTVTSSTALSDAEKKRLISEYYADIEREKLRTEYDKKFNERWGPGGIQGPVPWPSRMGPSAGSYGKSREGYFVPKREKLSTETTTTSTDPYAKY